VPGLLRVLARYGVPTAVIDESPWPRASAAAGRSPVAWIGAVNSREAGEKVGTHLLALGHRRVAYICPFADRDWSPPRLDGLRSVYAAAGLADAVSAYLDSAPELVAVARRTADPIVREALLPALKQLALLDDTPWPSPRIRDAFWERASQQLSGAAGWAASETLPATRALLPLAFRALRDAGHTAWVASNTTGGLLLLDLLESVGTRVPQDLSLVSFDDTFTATSRRLTAYDFDIEATANAAVNHVLNPGRSHYGVRLVSVSGRVNSRATTAAPARGSADAR
jgi:DNA-binding LacI/PurR family transcriptional regulator